MYPFRDTVMETVNKTNSQDECMAMKHRQSLLDIGIVYNL